jgi:membrane-associated phospholipid phosphatase
MKKILVILLSCLAFTTVYSQNTDIRLLKYINLNRNEHLDPGMRFLSNSTAAICVATPIIMTGYYFIKKDSLNFRKSFIIGTSVVTAGTIAVILKHVVNRERPFVTYPGVDRAISVNSSSFPSGHTSTSFSLATSLSLAYPKWYIIVPSYAWASSVAYSRMHLGVHYPTDVLAGAIIGAGSAYLNYKLNKMLGNRKLAQFIF